VSTNKLVMGHRDASGWHYDEQASVQGGVKSDTYYNMLLSVNGLNATLVVNNQMAFTHTFQARVVAGYSYGLNWGLVGVGSNNARGSFDNIAVQILPPQITFDQTVNFNDGGKPYFTGGDTGAWSVGNGVYSATPGTATGLSILDIGPDNLAVSSYLELSAKVSSTGRAGFVFDRYADGSFKFALIDMSGSAVPNTQLVNAQVIIGHYTPKSGWVNDAVVSKQLLLGSHSLGLSLKGTTVSVTVDSQTVAGYVFNAATVDGRFGLLARSAASFDDVRIKTDDAAFRTTTGGAQVASAGYAGATDSTLTQTDLDAVASVAISYWTQALGDGDARLAAFGDVRIGIADLADGELGYTNGATVLIDNDAAGAGWSTGLGGPDSRHMDLVSVVEHELGHVLGFSHEDAGLFPVMHEDLALGERYALAAAGNAPAAAAMHATPAAQGFDGPLPVLPSAANATIDWAATGGWSSALPSYSREPLGGFLPDSAADFSPFGKAAAKKATSQNGYDRLGQELLGKKRS